MDQLPEPNLIPVETKTPATSSPLFWPLIVAMSAFLLLFVGFIFWSLAQKPAASTQQATSLPNISQPLQQTTGSAVISGVVEFDGYASPGATVAISARPQGKNAQFQDVVTGLLPNAGQIRWAWKGVTAGTNYEVQASLKIQGKTIQESAPILISAPARDANLRLVSAMQPITPLIATISGTIDLKGYVPNGSTVTILAKTLSAATYGPVATAATSDNATWAWTGAATGTTYNMKAQIQSPDGTIISNNPAISVTAPSDSQVLLAQSTLSPTTATSVGISGTVTLNGSIPTGSYITIGARRKGAANFDQVISNVKASDGIPWNWGLAQSGTTYDIQAYLWVNSKPYAASTIRTISAPSTFETLTINAQQALSAPSLTTFTVACGAKLNNLFQASINYNTQSSLPNPQQYNLIITSGSVGGQVINSTVTPSNPTQPQTLTTTAILQPGATYFAQYAYATCINCNTFSPLSQPIQFACQ